MTSSRAVNDINLEPLRAQLGDRLSLPGEPSYDAAHGWNVAIPLTAAAIVHAQSIDDVTASVRFAARNGLTVSVQSTGHGAVAEADENVLLVCTEAFDQLTVDPASRIARIGAGVTWDHVLAAATPHGLAPICGSAPGVGVVGLLTGGGVGPLVRSHGLSADYVESFQLVTGDGEVRRVSTEEHPDLLWALRGGKSALGIVTELALRLVDLPQITGGFIAFDASDLAAVMSVWSEWVSELPEHATTSVAIMQLPPVPGVPEVLANKMTLAVRFASPEPMDECEAVLAPIRAVAEPLLDSIRPMSYAEIGSVHADPVDPMPAYEAGTMLKEFPLAAVDQLVRLTGPESGSPLTIVELRHLGGELASGDPASAAFSHRDANFSLLLIGVPHPDTAAKIDADARRVIDALSEWGTGGRMPNFAPGLPLRPDECRYDEPTLRRLLALVDRYDPNRVMRASANLGS